MGCVSGARPRLVIENERQAKMIPDELLDIQARLCKAIGQRARLKIIHSLREGERTVSELVELTGFTQSAVSRQLGVLRGAGILTARRQGRGVCYHITNLKIVTVCDLMREVLAEQFRRESLMLDGSDSPAMEK